MTRRLAFHLERRDGAALELDGPPGGTGRGREGDERREKEKSERREGEERRRAQWGGDDERLGAAGRGANGQDAV
eukprot:8267358-Pyramimonas_sp.AAC.1